MAALLLQAPVRSATVAPQSATEVTHHRPSGVGGWASKGLACPPGWIPVTLLERGLLGGAAQAERLSSVDQLHEISESSGTAL